MSCTSVASSHPAHSVSFKIYLPDVSPLLADATSNVKYTLALAWIFRVFPACIQPRKKIFTARTSFDIHYRLICMMDGTQRFSDVAATRSVMPSYQGQAGLLPVASLWNNDRECPRIAGTAPNTIHYVLPSASSFSFRLCSRQGDPCLSLFHPRFVSFFFVEPRPRSPPLSSQRFL